MKYRFIILIALILSSFEAVSDDSPKAWQLDNIISTLNQTKIVLDAVRAEQEQRLSEIKEEARAQNEILKSNLSFNSQSYFNEILKLSQDSMMLLEGYYAFSKQTQLLSESTQSSYRTKAFEECLKTNDCSFKKLNQMIDEEALKLCSQVKNDSVSMQKTLTQSIDHLNTILSQSTKDSSLDTNIQSIAAVSALCADLMVKLNTQISTLNTLVAHRMQLEHQNKRESEKASAKFFASRHDVLSDHMDIKIENTL